MNKRLAGVLIFALVVSAGASFLIYRLITARMPQQEPRPTNKLYVAAQTLQVGTLIKEVDIREVDWAGNVPAQAVTEREKIVGRGVIETIYQGEPILETRLAAEGAGAGLAAIIPPGMRAMAIRVNDVTSLAGYVTPGNRVDILILGMPPNAPQSLGTQTKTLLQNVEVLSAGPTIQKDSEGKPITVPVVNVLVTPEQAEILSLASQDARIQVVLRNPLDTEEAKPPGTHMARLWAGQPGVPQPAAAPPRARTTPRVVRERVVPANATIEPAKRNKIVVEILHGSQRKETEFGEEKSEEK